MKKILITGGAGFLGSNLCERLVKKDVQVFCLDNLFTGVKNNIRELGKYDNFNFLFHDVNQYIHLEVDEIYHLACPASPIHYQRNPVQTTKTAVIGTLNVLELARNVGAKILIASTSEIYGDSEEHPQPESYHGNVNTMGPRSCYDEGKRCAESLAYDFHRQYGVDVKVARIFNTYGPKMTLNDGRVVTNFVSQALKNEDITIYGNGTQTRSFCYVDDLLDGFIGFMDSDLFGPFNLGNPVEYTMLELAQQIINMTQSQSQLKFDGLPGDDPKRRRPDISQAKEFLNWTPKISLAGGLSKIIEDISHRIEL